MSANGIFDDGKDENAFRTIGEVAGALKIKPHVLRYWEEQFPMLRPVKRSGQRRYYRPEDVALLRTIDRLLNREGYTIKGAVRALKADASRSEPAGEASAALSPADGRTHAHAHAHTHTHAEAEQPPAADTALAASPDPRQDRAADPEIIARLRAIREKLAEALV